MIQKPISSSESTTKASSSPSQLEKAVVSVGISYTVWLRGRGDLERSLRGLSIVNCPPWTSLVLESWRFPSPGLASSHKKWPTKYAGKESIYISWNRAWKCYFLGLKLHESSGQQSHWYMLAHEFCESLTKKVTFPGPSLDCASSLKVKIWGPVILSPDWVQMFKNVSIVHEDLPVTDSPRKLTVHKIRASNQIWPQRNCTRLWNLIPEQNLHASSQQISHSNFSNILCNWPLGVLW